MHPMTLQWGRELAERFSPQEAAAIWRAFTPVDEALRRSYDASAAEFAGKTGRNDGSYNSRMPEGLLQLARFGAPRL
jgi:hypothetical protein